VRLIWFVLFFSHVVCRDLRYPVETPALTAERRFELHGVFPAHSTQNDVYQLVGESALEWLWEGFNATILAYGLSGTGKTYSLFGHGVVGELNGEGLCPRILAALFNRIAHAGAPDTFTVGMSCWDVHGSHAVDLLAADAEAPTVSRLVAVNVPSARQARQLLHFAHSRSINWSRALGSGASRERDRACG